MRRYAHVSRAVLLCTLFGPMGCSAMPTNPPAVAMDPSPMPMNQQVMQAPMPAAPLPIAAPLAAGTQLTWPDTVELSENEIGLAQVSNPEIINAYKQAHTTLSDIATLIDQMTKTRNEIYQQYFTQIAIFDDFLQTIDYTKGTLEETRIAEK